MTLREIKKKKKKAWKEKKKNPRMLQLIDKPGVTCMAEVNELKIGTLFNYADRWILRKETLIEGFRIRDTCTVRETSDMIHQSIFCITKSKETKLTLRAVMHERSLESRARHVKVSPFIAVVSVGP